MQYVKLCDVIQLNFKNSSFLSVTFHEQQTEMLEANLAAQIYFTSISAGNLHYEHLFEVLGYISHDLSIRRNVNASALKMSTGCNQNSVGQ
jgi:hypothetical protein